MTSVPVSLLWQFGSDWRALRMLLDRPKTVQAFDISRELRAKIPLGGDALVFRPR